MPVHRYLWIQMKFVFFLVTFDVFFPKVGLEFQTRLLNVNLTAVDKSTQKEVEMFLIAIQKNPPIMNLDQYADINRSLITSVIAFKEEISFSFKSRI